MKKMKKMKKDVEDVEDVEDGNMDFFLDYFIVFYCI